MRLVVTFADIRERTAVSSTSGIKQDCIQSCIPAATGVERLASALLQRTVVIVAT